MTEIKAKKSGLEFEVPEGWKVTDLGKVVDFLDGKRRPIKDSDRAKMRGIYPYYGASGIIDYVNDFIFDEELILLGEDGANILNRSSPLAFKVSGKIWVNNHAHVLKPKVGTDLNFLVEYLESIKYDKYNTGTAQPKLNKEVCSRIPIVFPPLPEQRAIAQVLGKMDEAIQTTERLIAQKELRKKWLMQNLLTGKMRLKGFSGEWREHYLGDFFQERKETGLIDLELLSIGQEGIYPQSESAKKDTSNSDKAKYKRICPGDIGYNTMRMWQGRSALSHLEGIVSPAYTIVKPMKNADSLFFSYLFKLDQIIHLFWRNSQGLVDDTLNCKFKDFSIVKVVLPQTREEQTTIARVLQTADQEISLLKSKADKLWEQKKGMMQVLLTGKVRIGKEKI
jgi:Restriction endonuclease S subunits